MKKILITTSLLLIICATSVTAQSCLPEGITFVIQQDIEEFQENYPDCTEISGFVEIHGSLWDLGGLSNITSIGGNLRIIDCDDLTSLEGLNSLTTIGGKLEIYECQNLSNLNGLESLISIGGDMEIHQNYNMISLYGLSSLATIGGYMEIMSNSNMMSLYGLSSLVSVGGDLILQNNGDLVEIDGLINLTSIGGSLNITNNDDLPSLSGLDNIDHNSMDEIVIIYNNHLSTCDVESVCSFILNETGFATIYGNSTGCNSPDEIEEACDGVSVSEIDFSENLLIHPNPFTTFTTIEYELKQPSAVQLSIFNQLGQLVYQHSEKQTQGTQQLQWDAQDQPEGLYYYQLQAGDQILTGKLVKAR
jgi:hypothetical protein